MSTGRQPRIAVLGSANVDLVVHAVRAPRPGETVTGASFETVPGGKGANQALAAARAGGRVSFLGAVGDDPYGARVRELLATEGVDVSALATVDEPTGTAHIVVEDGGENSIVVVPGANATMRELSDAHRERIAASDVLLLQLEVPLDIVVEAARHARAHGVRVILTPAPAQQLPERLFADIDLLVPNEHEAVLLSGAHDIEEAGRSLHRLGCDVLITVGASGSRYFAGEEQLSVPAFTVSAVDTTAAGDTFVGAYAVASTELADRRAAIRWASAAAALTVARAGASSSIPRRHEITQFLLDRAE